MKKIYLTVILILFSLNIFWIAKYSRQNKLLQNELTYCSQVINSKNLSINNLQDLLKSTYINKFNKDWNKITDKIDGEKIVLFITKGQCYSCIIQLLAYLEQVGSKIGNDKIVVLGNFKNNKDFTIFKDNASVYLENALQCYIPELPEEISEHPTIFFVDKNFTIRHLYIPDLYSEFQETYFTNLLPEYFE